MEKLQSNPVIEFNLNQLQEVRKLSGYGDAKEMSQALDKLEDWIRKQNHFAVKEFDRDYLERLIVFNKGSIERAKQRLDKTCTLRSLLPEFMSNIDVKHEFEHHRSKMHHCLFPKPTKDNYRIVFASFKEPDERFDLVTYYRYTFMIHQYGLFHDYIAGIEVVIDSRQLTFSMMSKFNPLIAHKGITMLLQTFGSRIKAFHFICSSKVVDGALTLIRSILSEKLNKRIHLHSSFESLCKVIDKSLLPVEIGGEYNKTLKELSDELFEELSSESNIARLKNLDKAVAIESQRLIGSFNEEYSGMPGSFKSLCVD